MPGLCCVFLISWSCVEAAARPLQQACYAYCQAAACACWIISSAYATRGRSYICSSIWPRDHKAELVSLDLLDDGPAFQTKLRSVTSRHKPRVAKPAAPQQYIARAQRSSPDSSPPRAALSPVCKFPFVKPNSLVCPRARAPEHTAPARPQNQKASRHAQQGGWPAGERKRPAGCCCRRFERQLYNGAPFACFIFG